MTEDRRKETVPGAPERRYGDAKAASASAASRIAKAAAECIGAMRSYCEPENQSETMRRAG